MDMKRKTCHIRTLGKNVFLDISSTQHWCTCPIALPVGRNQQHKSLLTVVSAISACPFQPLRHLRNACHPGVNCFTRQTLPIVNRKHFLMNILCIGSLYSTKKLTRECCSWVVYSSSTVAILTTETSLWTCACASATWTVSKLDCAAT
jgi:hypothetical protein